MTTIIGGPSAGDTTDATGRVILLRDPLPTADDSCGFAYEKTVYYTRRLFGFQADDGERTTVAFYAPEDWSDERAFYELLDGYSKGLTPAPDSA